MANTWELLYPKLPRSWWVVRTVVLAVAVSWIAFRQLVPHSAAETEVLNAFTPYLLLGAVCFAAADYVMYLRARKALRERLY